MKDFITFQLGIILHPLSTLKKYLEHKNRLIYGLITILLFSICYTIGVALAYIFNHPPYGIGIILKIPVEKYYLYESFFLLPVTVCTWILLAGLIRIISIPFKGSGSFEETLSVTGLPFFILIIFMFIPDLIINSLIPESIVQSYIFWNIINPIRLFLASCWILIVHILAVKEVQKVSIIKAVIITIFSYIPYMGIVMTYIR